MSKTWLCYVITMHQFVLCFFYRIVFSDLLYISLIFTSCHMSLEQGLFVKVHLKASAVNKEGLRTLGVVEGTMAHTAPRCSDGKVPTVKKIP